MKQSLPSSLYLQVSQNKHSLLRHKLELPTRNPQITSYAEARSRKPVISISNMPGSSRTAEGLSWDSPVFVKGAAQLPSPVQLPPPLPICIPLPPNGSLACPGHLQFSPLVPLLAPLPLAHGEAVELVAPLCSKPCPCSPPLNPSAQCFIQSLCTLSLLIISTSLNIWFLKLLISN